MIALVRVTACAVLLSAALAAPAWAKTTGQQAVNLCHKTKNCTVDIAPTGDVLIIGPTGGIVTCPSLTAACTAHPNGRTSGGAGRTTQTDPTRAVIVG